MASEDRAWQALKRSIDREPVTLGWKIQDAWRKGLPDVVLCHRGVPAWLELKHLKAFPKRELTTVKVNTTEEQRRHLIDWRNAGGLSYVLLAIGNGRKGTWFLLEPHLEEVRHVRAAEIPAALVAGPWADHTALLAYLRGPGRRDVLPVR